MIYTTPSEAVGLEILEALSRRYPAKHDEQPAESLVYYDTFDWRLHRAGGLFTGVPSPRGFRLTWTRGGAGNSHRIVVDAVPAFAREFPAGALRDEIAPILSMRRLLPIVEVEHRSRTLHVMDDEEKTVVRVVLREATARPPEEDRRRSLPTTLRTVPLRGYGHEHRELARVLETDLGLASAEQDDFTMALAAVGREAGDYTSKLRLHLEPTQPSSEAAVEIFRSLLETLLANEDGTRRDLDSEFLHDFRVSVRRTRSALTQLKQVLPRRVSDHYRGEFKWLGNATGPTRDLDVYLLKIDGYEASLPESIRADLEPLRHFLERHQRLEQKRLVGVLDSKRYRELVEGWRRFLAEPVKSSAANAARPVGELASERIRKAFRRVWKKGNAIGPESPAEALHELRIDCKKLRYLLEFFRSLYPSSEIDPLVKALKQLQDNLGDFNDLEVQQEKLRDFARQMGKEGEVAPATLLAMGELVADLRRLQEEERLAFAEHFGRFSEHRGAFRRL